MKINAQRHRSAILPVATGGRAVGEALRRIRRGRLWIPAVTTLLLSATPQVAWTQNEDSPWRLGFELGWVDPSGSFVTTSVGGATIESSIDTGFGAGIRGEYQFSSRLGVEIGVFSAGSVDVASSIVGGTISNEVEISTFTPISVGLNVHLTVGRPVDFYVGPQLALVSYSDVDVRSAIASASTSVSVDNDVGWGAILGVDVPVGERGWLVHAGVRYIDTDMKDSRDAAFIDSEFDPLILSIGAGYRF